MRLAASPAEIDAGAWDELLALQTRPTPFLKHAFLLALTESGSATAATGWAPRFMTLWRDAETPVNRASRPAADTAGDEITVTSTPEPPGPHEILVAAVPLYVKSHSYGEYVFDWAWANAYQRHGLSYYPKLLCAVPFTPVTGARLLARDDDARFVLARTMMALAEQSSENGDPAAIDDDAPGETEGSGLSSLHVLYPTEHEANVLARAGMMERSGVQFHWHNAGYPDFETFLATLEQKKRKNIRAERRRVREAGVSLRRVRGEDVTPEDWRFFNRCYRQTYREHHSSPYLNLAFFTQIAAAMPENLLLVIAEREGKPVASSLVFYQREPDGGTLFGRYWGAVEAIPCLHFETAYYQPLEFCIEQGLAVFEGGAQGEHKMARGFMPTVTRSLHWLAHPGFRDAVAHFLDQETAGIGDYVDELHERNPFKQTE